MVQEEFKAQVIQEEVVHLMIQVFQALEVVRNIHQVFRFNRVAIHQMMEETEETQEETQKMMTVMNHMIPIKIVSSIENHRKTQTRVENATRFDLVDELYALPVKMPTIAAWLEDWMTKLVVADEVAAHIEPRRAMAVLMNVGKPLQTSDNDRMGSHFPREWASRRCDHCEPPGCLSQVSSSKLNVHNNVCPPRRPFQPLRPSRQDPQTEMDARMEIIASMHIPEPTGSVCDVALSHTIFRLVPVLADTSLLDQTV